MPYNILLVDDSRSFREEFAATFDNYKIIEAASGKEALQFLKKPNSIDLVILDVKLPDIEGTKVLRLIREMDPHLGVIILTGYSSKETAIESLRGNADDYIEKPVDVEKTKKIISKLLNEKVVKQNLEALNIEGIMEKVKDFITRNYDKKISLKDVAAEFYLSPKYLSRKFKETTKTGFGEYKIKVKIDKAKDFLKNTGYTVYTIALKLGYENTESFNRIFKKFTGMTPSEYREKNKINSGYNSSSYS
jgi:two-component system, response regulator YesN